MTRWRLDTTTSGTSRRPCRPDPVSVLASRVPTALITGATQGLGSAFADRLAADGFDLVLVDRERAHLEAVAARARRSGAVEVLVADLADPAARSEVEHRLADPDRPVDVLVNNAAAEAKQSFIGADVHKLQAEIDLNVTTVMVLSHAVLPGMIDRGHGSVINVASFAGYLAASGDAFAATKSWELAFTDTVSASLAGTGVGMIAVCVGNVRTEKQAGPAGRSRMWLDPATVVDVCLHDLARGRSLSTPGWVYRSVVGTLELPRRTLRTLAKVAGRDRARHDRAAAQRDQPGDGASLRRTSA